jgi:hypothetical protein
METNIDISNVSIGFIILRHVNNKKINTYWIKSYAHIRKYYPENEIVIIDDNSNYEFVTEENLYKTTIIQSEFPGRGELLPYYYYLKNKWFDIAVIIHDSVFINKYFDFHVDTYKMLWEFEHNWDKIKDETPMIQQFNDTELLKFYQNTSLWKGCFGGMTIIRHEYLDLVNSKYNICTLLDLVKTRPNRKSFERVIAVLLQKNKPNVPSLLGNIHKYCPFGASYESSNKKRLPIIKVWSGR